MDSTKPTLVIALGGNAMLQPGQKGTYEEQTHNVDVAAVQMVKLMDSANLVITSGNGPQVGCIIVQNTKGAEAKIPEQPMHACGAMSQGFIGYMMQQSIGNELRAQNKNPEIVTLITQTLVDPEDPAFSNPSKPVGTFFTEEQAKEKMAADPSIVMKEDAGRGWRVVVPSPKPMTIVERPIIEKLSKSGSLVVCTNGGGIPCKLENNKVVGVNAVIDKDLATSLLAQELNADYLMILTDVPFAYVDYRKETQRALGTITLDEAMKFIEEGQFAKGSMGPKVQACVNFVKATGKPAIITSLNAAVDALAEKTGTRIVANKN